MFAVVGDWNEANATHRGTNEALVHARGSFEWVPTEECLDATVPYYCSYGLDQAWEAPLAARGLRVSARGPDGEARMVELDDHPFFVGTLFIPQMRSAEGAPDPLVAAFVAAAG